MRKTVRDIAPSNVAYIDSYNQSDALQSLTVQHERPMIGEHANCCDQILLLGIMGSLLICLLAKFFQVSHCCAAGFFMHVLFTGVSTLEHFKQNGSLCRLTYMWEAFFLLLWALAWHVAIKPWTWHIKLLIQGASAAKLEYEHKLSLMPGPLKDCYESTFFLQKCEKAIDNVTCDGACTVSLHEFTAAGPQVTYDPDFLCGTLLWTVVRFYSQYFLRKSDAIMVLKRLSAIHLEDHGSHMPCCYCYNVLQLPLNSDMQQARQQYDILRSRWSKEGTEEQIIANLKFLQHYFDAVACDIIKGCSTKVLEPCETTGSNHCTKSVSPWFTGPDRE